MVGLSSDFQQHRVESSSRKRRTTEDLVREGNRKEEKKLRVEQVVTALGNTDKGKEANIKRENSSPVATGDETCVCGTNGMVNLAAPGQFYARAFRPATKVTFALNPVPNDMEHGMRERIAAANNAPYFRPFVASVQGRPIHQPIMQPENIPLPIINADGDGSDVIRSPQQQSISFIPVLREHPAAGTPAGYENVDIIRVPRDNKTPFVVFKPELHLGHNLGPPRFPGTLTPSRNTLQTISLPTHMSPFCSADSLRSNVMPNFQPGLLPSNLLRYPVPRTRDNMTAFSTVEPESRDNHNRNTQRWSAVLVPQDDRHEILERQKTRYSDPHDHENVDISKYPDQLSMWSIDNVHDYLKDRDFCDYADVFKSQEIDGKALRLLDEITISRLLEVKMGPAIKLAFLIKSLIDRTID